MMKAVLTMVRGGKDAGLSDVADKIGAESKAVLCQGFLEALGHEKEALAQQRHENDMSVEKMNRHENDTKPRVRTANAAVQANFPEQVPSKQVGPQEDNSKKRVQNAEEAMKALRQQLRKGTGTMSFSDEIAVSTPATGQVQPASIPQARSSQLRRRNSEGDSLEVLRKSQGDVDTQEAIQHLMEAASVAAPMLINSTSRSLANSETSSRSNKAVTHTSTEAASRDVQLEDDPSKVGRLRGADDEGGGRTTLKSQRT